MLLLPDRHLMRPELLTQNHPPMGPVKVVNRRVPSRVFYYIFSGQYAGSQYSTKHFFDNIDGSSADKAYFESVATAPAVHDLLRPHPLGVQCIYPGDADYSSCMYFPTKAAFNMVNGAIGWVVSGIDSVNDGRYSATTWYLIGDNDGAAAGKVAGYNAIVMDLGNNDLNVIIGNTANDVTPSSGFEWDSAPGKFLANVVVWDQNGASRNVYWFCNGQSFSSLGTTKDVVHDYGANFKGLGQPSYANRTLGGGIISALWYTGFPLDLGVARELSMDFFQELGPA